MVIAQWHCSLKYFLSPFCKVSVLYAGTLVYTDQLLDPQKYISMGVVC
jgi:hypothetical protein